LETDGLGGGVGIGALLHSVALKRVIYLFSQLPGPTIPIGPELHHPHFFGNMNLYINKVTYLTYTYIYPEDGGRIYLRNVKSTVRILTV
jgi:hypothetical protein